MWSSFYGIIPGSNYQYGKELRSRGIKVLPDTYLILLKEKSKYVNSCLDTLPMYIDKHNLCKLMPILLSNILITIDLLVCIIYLSGTIDWMHCTRSYTLCFVCLCELKWWKPGNLISLESSIRFVYINIRFYSLSEQ